MTDALLDRVLTDKITHYDLEAKVGFEEFMIDYLDDTKRYDEGFKNIANVIVTYCTTSKISSQRLMVSTIIGFLHDAVSGDKVTSLHWDPELSIYDNVAKGLFTCAAELSSSSALDNLKDNWLAEIFDKFNQNGKDLPIHLVDQPNGQVGLSFDYDVPAAVIMDFMSAINDLNRAINGCDLKITKILDAAELASGRR